MLIGVHMFNSMFSSDCFVWDCFVREYFAIRDCFVRDCSFWDCFVCSLREAICWKRLSNISNKTISQMWFFVSKNHFKVYTGNVEANFQCLNTVSIISLNQGFRLSLPNLNIFQSKSTFSSQLTGLKNWEGKTKNTRTTLCKN